MRTRKLGKTGVELTTVGLGTWAHGGQWKFGWGPQDDSESIRAIHAALDLGINWIDTAAVYGLGHSELVLGRALRERSGRPFIATKCGLVWDAQGGISQNLSANSVRSECEASLKRLGLDCIDLYQIHWPFPDEQIEEAWGVVGELIDQGKVRFGGVSNFTISQIERVQKIRPAASLQAPYSLLARDIENGLLPYCARNGIGVVVYSPLQKGLLSGKITHQYVASLPDGDHRKHDPLFMEPMLTSILQKVDELREYARPREMTAPQLAIAWLLRRCEVTSVIVGARNEAQIRGTAPAADLLLNQEDFETLERIFRLSQ